MIYRHQNRHKPDRVCSNCQGHEKPQEQRLKRMFKSNFQTRNKRKLCDLKTRKQDVHNKHEEKSLLC
jgi:hypothetical protein